MSLYDQYEEDRKRRSGLGDSSTKPSTSGKSLFDQYQEERKVANEKPSQVAAQEQKKPSLFENIKTGVSNLIDQITGKKKIEEKPVEVPGIDLTKANISAPTNTTEKNLFDFALQQTPVSGASSTVVPGKEKDIVEIPGRAVKNVAAGITSDLKMVADTVKWRTEVGQGPEFSREIIGNVAQKASDKFASWSQALQPEDPNMADQILQGFGSTVPFYVLGFGIGNMAGTLAKVSPLIAGWFGAGASGFVESGMNAGDVYEQNKKSGKSTKEADEAASRTFMANIGVNIILDKFGYLNENAKGIVKKAFLSSTTESLQEMTQQVISNVNTGRPWNEGVLETGAVSAVVGSTGGLVPEIKSQTTITMTPEDALANATGSDLSNTPAGKKLAEFANKAQSEGKSVAVDLTGASGEIVETPEGNKIGIEIVETPKKTVETDKKQTDSGTTTSQNAPEKAIETPVVDTLQNLINKAQKIESKGRDAYQRYWVENKGVPVGPYNKNWRAFVSQEDLTKLESLDNQIQEMKGKKESTQGLTPEVKTKGIINYESKKSNSKVTGWIEQNEEIGKPAIGVIDRIDVSSNQQGKGIGTSEVKEFEDWASKKGVGELRVESEQGARGFWRKMGYTEVSDRNGELVTMVKTIPQSGLTPEVKQTEVSKVEGITAPTPQKEIKMRTSDEINKPLRDFYSSIDPEKLGIAQMEVMAELEVSEAGTRLVIDNKYGPGETVVGISSTFPKWIPEELRSKKLFDKVLAGIVDLEKITYPDSSSPRMQRLYDEILSKIESRAGIDGSSIRDNIIKEYDERKASIKEQKANKPKRPVRESIEGSQGQRKQEKVSQVVETGPGIKEADRIEAVKKPVEETKGKSKLSRVAERVLDQLKEVQSQDITYKPMNIVQDAAKASEFVEQNPEISINIAKGLELPPPDITETAISIAAAQKARDNGDWVLYTRLILSRTFRQTRRGQEIVAERGRMDENSVEFFIRQLVSERARIVESGKKWAYASKSMAKIKVKEIVKRETVKLKETIDKKVLTKLESAQKIIDSLTCKI